MVQSMRSGGQLVAPAWDAERLGTEEIANYLGVPVRRVQYLAKMRQIPAMKAGKRYVFIKDDVEAWAAQRYQGGA